MYTHKPLPAGGDDTTTGGARAECLNRHSVDRVSKRCTVFHEKLAEGNRTPVGDSGVAAIAENHRPYLYVVSS